jgi:hypothetical protein
MMLGQEPRQTTSNVGHLNKPSIQVCGGLQGACGGAAAFRCSLPIAGVAFFCFSFDRCSPPCNPPHALRCFTAPLPQPSPRFPCFFPPPGQALIHGLNRHYYSIAINYRKTPLEERMLGNLQVGLAARQGNLQVGLAGACWGTCRWGWPRGRRGVGRPVVKMLAGGEAAGVKCWSGLQGQGGSEGQGLSEHSKLGAVPACTPAAS